MDLFNSIVNIINYLAKGGISMIFIFLASVTGVAVAIERYFFLKKTKKSISKLFEITKEKILKGDIRDVLAICDAEKSPASNILKTALEARLKGATREEIEASVEEITKIELPILNKYLYILGTMVTISPMLGLLGTVLGMIKSTEVLAEKGLSSPSELLAGIAEALITTAAGLIVAIPLLVIYNYLVNEVEEITQEIESKVSEIILLSSTKSIW
ncbi:MAG: MotA/TolQ/ExbB proton channel family protein [Brevinematia bacterium]